MNTPVVNQSPVQDTPIEVPPALKRVGQITGSLAVGALGGYIFYWITRLFARVGFLGEEGKGVINPLPYVLSGVASATIVETAKLVYDAAMAVLGDRSLYQTTPSDKASTLEKFRHHSWKLISKAEGIQEDADVVFSRLFGMRTSKGFRDNWKDIGKAAGIQEDVNVAFSWLTDSWISKDSLERELKAFDKEIDALGKERGDLDQELSNQDTSDKRRKVITNRENEISDRETAIDKRKKEIAEIDLSFKKISEIDLSFMEISRIAFWQQVSETLSTSVPQELGVYLVEACGYTIIGGHLFVWLHGLTFMNGLIGRIGEVYKKMDAWNAAPAEDDVKANDQVKPETVETGDVDLESEKEASGKQASGDLVLCPT